MSNLFGVDTDCSSGETTTSPLTDAQVNDLDAIATESATLAAAQLTLSTNQATITANLTNSAAAIETWIANNPNGAVLTAAQTLVLAKMLNALFKIVLAEFSSTIGT